MRIALIWPYYPPELGAASNRGVALAGYLEDAGHEVTLCAPEASYLVSRGDSAPQVPVKTRIHARLRTSHRSRLVRVAREAIGSLSVPAAIWPAVRSADVAVVSSPPLLFGLAGVFTAAAARTPILLDIRDLWPDVVIESGEVSGGRIMAIASRAARSGYRAASAISVVTRGSVSKLVKQGVDPEKIIMAPNGVDEALLHPDPNMNGSGFAEIQAVAEETRQKRRPQFRLVYAGLLGPAQGVGILFDALKRVSLPIRVDIIGDGSEAVALENRAEDSNAEVRFHGLLSRREALLISARSDAAFVPLASPGMADTIPSKLFETMALSLPVVAVASGEAAEIVDDADGGLVSPPRDPVALASNISRLASDRDESVRMGRSGRAYVERNFVRERIFAGFLDKLEELAASGRRSSGR